MMDNSVQEILIEFEHFRFSCSSLEWRIVSISRYYWIRASLVKVRHTISAAAAAIIMMCYIMLPIFYCINNLPSFFSLVLDPEFEIYTILNSRKLEWKTQPKNKLKKCGRIEKIEPSKK